MVVSSALTVAVLAVVFAGIFPRIADYSEAWTSIRQLPTGYVAALVVATVVNLAVYVWPLQAALPGLGYGPGFVVRQTSFAISNAVPAGGAVGLGVQYGMLDSYGFGAGAAASAIGIVSVFNVFAILVMPVLGVVALLASGVVEGTYLLVAAIGILAIGVAVVAFTAVLRGLETGTGNVAVTWTEALAAFSFSRVASFLPVTPGGLGTVDAALAGLLAGAGATSGQALAADLVWRAATYVPQVLLGVLTFLWWRVSAARRRERVVDPGFH